MSLDKRTVRDVARVEELSDDLTDRLGQLPRIDAEPTCGVVHEDSETDDVSEAPRGEQIRSFRTLRLRV